MIFIKTQTIIQINCNEKNHNETSIIRNTPKIIKSKILVPLLLRLHLIIQFIRFIKRLPILLNVLGRFQTKQLTKLLAEVFDIIKAGPESSFVYVAIRINKEAGGFSQTNKPDKFIDRAPGNGFYLFIQRRVAHPHFISQNLNVKVRIIEVLFGYRDTLL